MPHLFLRGELKQFNILRDGDRVVLLYGGRRVTEMPWEAAEALGRALIIQAHKAEEQAKAESIIYDHAILTRAGFPIGLTSRPDMQDEVRKEAAWNSDLRRYMPGGVKSHEVFGTPSIIKHDPEVPHDQA